MSEFAEDPYSDAYAKNTAQQYEALGRFVEAFELMVYEVREIILNISARDSINYPLFEAALHHSSLSAKPLFDILRAVIGEVLGNAIKQKTDRENGIYDTSGPIWRHSDGRPVDVSLEERDIVFGAMTAIESEYTHLISRRNDLLHGTWFIGFPSADDPTSAEFHIRRFKTSKTGLKRVDGLPKNAGELDALRHRCHEVRDWLGRIEQCFQLDLKIPDTFRFENGECLMTDPPGTKRTLPRR